MNGIQEAQKLEYVQNASRHIGTERKNNIPKGFCQCGCGGITSLSRQTCKSRGYKKGEPKRFIHGHHSRGFRHPSWKGGRTTSRGYVIILFPEHPFSTARGYVRESRLVAEKALGKYINIKHPVHHHNGKISDNSPKNLVVCEDNAYHRLLHVRMNAYNTCGNAFWQKCCFCGNYDDPKNMYVYPNGKYGRHRSCRNKHLKEMRKQNAAKLKAKDAQKS